MSYQLHFLRPEWFFALIPLICLGYLWLAQKPFAKAWSKYCDKNLMPYLAASHAKNTSRRAKVYLLLAALFIILSLTGPAGYKLDTPTYQTTHPRLILLDLSEDMLEKDLTPNRLARAKFKLHDLFKIEHEQKGQFALMVYTSEPFVVSPFTQDAQTIDALIHELSPTIMPVGGMNLARALTEADDIIKQAYTQDVDVLVITGAAPSKTAIDTARHLHQAGKMNISILPMLPSNQAPAKAFNTFAASGGGVSLRFTHTDKDIKTWLEARTKLEALQAVESQTVQVWRDDGRILILPALLCLLPVFRRGWLSRVIT